MPVPEPSAEAGLWPQVEYVTGWPETDEDRLAELARMWRTGGERFTAGGQFDLTGLGGIWPDPAGEAAGERTRGTLINAMALAGGMDRLADRVDGFAAAVRACKIDISAIVEAGIPRWKQALALPPGIGAIDQQVIRDDVINQVEARIAGCVRDIGGLGLTPVVPPDVRMPPAPVLDAQENPTSVIQPQPGGLLTGTGPAIMPPPGLLPGAAGGPLPDAGLNFNTADEPGPDGQPGLDGPTTAEVLVGAGLDPGRVATLTPEQQEQVKEALERWNTGQSGHNQGVEHVIDYAEGKGGSDKENRLPSLAARTGTPAVDHNDPYAIPKVTETLDDVKQRPNVVSTETVNQEGKPKKIYFVPEGGAQPDADGNFPKKQRGIVIIENDGKLSTFFNADFKRYGSLS